MNATRAVTWIPVNLVHRHTCSVFSVSSVVIEPRERVLKFTAEELQTG